MRNSNRRLMRWALFVQAFNLDMKHVVGKDNVLADAMSHITLWRWVVFICVFLFCLPVTMLGVEVLRVAFTPALNNYFQLILFVFFPFKFSIG